MTKVTSSTLFTAGLLFVSLALVACSSTPTNNQATTNGNCADEQKISVTDHISSQILAFEQKNWDKAYSYASDSFQKNINLDDFQTIILDQYPFLVNNSGYTFGNCTTNADGIFQNLTINSDSQTYQLIYNLILEDGELGILAARVLSAAENVAI
jgi:hypothetical protein